MSIKDVAFMIAEAMKFEGELIVCVCVHLFRRSYAESTLQNTLFPFFVPPV